MQLVLHRLEERAVVVDDRPDPVGVGAGLLARRDEQVAVAVADEPVPQGQSRLHQLRPGRDDGDARTGMDEDDPAAHGGQDGDLPRPDERAGGEHDLAGDDVLGRAADVGAGVDRGRDADGLGAGVGALDGDDGIRAVGHRRAGHDPHGGAGPDGLGGAVAGRDVVDDRQLDRRGLARAGDVGGEHGVPVHRRVVERRERPGGRDVGREDAAVGGRERELERRQDGDASEDPVCGTRRRSARVRL